MLLWYPKYLASTCMYLNWTRCANGEALKSGCTASAAYASRGMSGNRMSAHRTKTTAQKRVRKEDMLLWYPKYPASPWMYSNWACCANGEALNTGCGASAVYLYRGLSGNHIRTPYKNSGVEKNEE
jgi:hypothetical protein